NWGEGGAHGFARPGLWADADPKKQVQWFEDMNANVIHSFGVSCNGYAWYKNGVVPAQPGLKYDFLPGIVHHAHKKRMKVFAYFCVGANNKWEEDHPDLVYHADGQQIPFTKQYIDYLCASIEDVVRKVEVDGIMLDWFYNPGGGRDPLPPLRWLPCEEVMYKELMGEVFPGKEKMNPGIELEFRRRAIDRIWKRVREVVKGTRPDCLIWLTCYELNSKEIVGSDMLNEVDWLMNEAGDMANTEIARKTIRPETKLITCLANWNKQNPTELIPYAIREGIGLFGFTKPVIGSMMHPINYYLSKPIESFEGDARNIAALTRSYHDLPFSYVKK
ncbi:MAG: family 10 glycosylhydrolase, partial [Chitinophagaceae bacterium]|nr:family 10 glycosylhydrolase [Chitinophagaceae bacterium]